MEKNSIKKEDLISAIIEANDLITMEEANLILNEISTFVKSCSTVENQSLYYFIEKDLCIFTDKDHAFNWFFNDEEEGIISIYDIDFTITEDMIGKDIKDILLESKENYIYINDNLHLTYWL